ncbi:MULTISPECIES: hypothetical protein [Roseivirga]|uniref:hypothetical protein n=1 Tax=Roseivirga TaxID=290180 RepID=UPI00257DCD3E|nr:MULTISPECIES: hypothetical protein [Roseivirga]MEC7754666.1 hypothetical protein [Bacteroidota bacterium]|tara:strand:- start:3519 stop:3962 length:444 start_codon:yes stop_codon:yes gene_type:complete
MIVSRPKRNTIFALGVSTLICGFGSLYFMRQVLAEPDGVWRYIVLGILLLCTSILIYKLLFNYKVIKISHDLVHIYYPFRFFKTVQPIKDLGAWQETIIETNKTEFRELKLVFMNKGFVKITNQENSDYDKVYKYVKKKAPKKEVKE